jgi:hypothetical protein
LNGKSKFIIKKRSEKKSEKAVEVKEKETPSTKKKTKNEKKDQELEEKLMEKRLEVKHKLTQDFNNQQPKPICDHRTKHNIIAHQRKARFIS